MRLVLKIKSLYHRLINERLLLLILLFSIPQTGLRSQGLNHTFHDTPLSEALQTLSEKYNIKLAFDAGKLSEIIVDREISGQSVDELLGDLLGKSGFSFRYRYNRYLIVRNSGKPGDSAAIKGQITGSVTDKESGESLPYATIMLFDHNAQISATENGSFCLRDISSNPVHLAVSYIGYNVLDTSFSWTDPDINIRLSLVRKEHVLDTINVRADKVEMIDLRNDVDFATTINPAKLSDLPVMAETDVFRMLQLLPGVNYSENSAGLSIRGGSADQNLVLFDGQTLYNLSHYYGAVSAINPNVIKDLQIYKGGYDSRFGERVSGIIDITGKSGSRTKPVIYGDINLLSGNITAELPLSEKLTFLGAFRRSYSDIYSTSFSNGLFERNMDWFRHDSNNIVNQTKPDFSFHDYNARLTFRPGNLETIALSLYGGKDSYVNSYSGTSRNLVVEGTDRNTWSNYGVSLTWQKQWKQSFYSNIQTGTSGYSNTSSNNTLIDRSASPVDSIPSLPEMINPFNTYNRNDLGDIYVSVKNTFRISNNNQLNFGMLARRNTIFYHKDAGDIYIYDNSKQTGWTTSAFAQEKISFGTDLTIKPGIRLTYFNGTGRIFLEPRFSVSYEAGENVSLRLAAGRYYQFINQAIAQQETGYNKNFWVMADNIYHPEVSSNHFVAGITAGKGKFMFDGEAYIKTFSGIQEYLFVSQFLKNTDFPGYFPKKAELPPPDPEKPSYFITGVGRSYGIDMLLRYKNSNYSGWISYSWGRSLHRFSDLNNGEEVPSPYDIPHQLSLTNMLSTGKWNFSTISVFTSGRSYVDYTKSRTELPLYRTYGRLPDYFRTDLSVNYTFRIRKNSFKTGATIINVFNTENYFDINTRKFDFENSSFSETTLVQSQALSLNLFLHFMF